MFNTYKNDVSRLFSLSEKAELFNSSLKPEAMQNLLWSSWWKEWINFHAHLHFPQWDASSFCRVWCKKGKQHLNFREIWYYMSEFPNNSVILKVPTFSKTLPDLSFGDLFFLNPLQDLKITLVHPAISLAWWKTQTLSSYDAIMDIFKWFVLYFLFP